MPKAIVIGFKDLADALTTAGYDCEKGSNKQVHLYPYRARGTPVLSPQLVRVALVRGEPSGRAQFLTPRP